MTLCARGPGRIAFWVLAMSAAVVSVCALDSDPVDWKDWLLDEAARRPSSEAEPGPPARRITPKSVFVAPGFSGCSEGYAQDAMGRCVKLVKVNQAAQLDFILQKLNSKFAQTDTKKKEEDSGPFHVNIPLGYATKEKVASRNESKLETPATVPAGTAAEGEPEDASTEAAAPTVLNETDHRLQSENTVKRQPGAAGGDRPFVIIVADTRDRPTTDPPADVTESTPSAQDAATDTTAATTAETFYTEEGTPSYFDASTVEEDRLPTSFDEVIETSTIPAPVTFVPYDTDGVDVYTSAASVPEEEVKKPVGDESFTHLPVETAVPAPSPAPFASHGVPEMATGCADSPETEFGYRCGPTTAATAVQYPVRTAGAYHTVRFPTDDNGDRHKNGFVRFPDRYSVSPHRPSHAEPFRLRPDADGASAASTSPGASWYPPPPSWFPFFQSRKTWMNRYGSRLQYENANANAYAHKPLLPVSTVFRKQYHDYRPPPPPAWPHLHRPHASASL